MPLLGFTKLRSKLLDGSKTQTIRKPRKHPIKEGDILHIYWKLRTKKCEKLGEGIVIKVIRKRLFEINSKDAILDGFKNIDEFYKVFCGTLHPHTSMDGEFDIITWRWTKTQGNLAAEKLTAFLRREVPCL